ncbi:unnamed protein product [Blepharisma stoltei]|uniref:Transmembrane protein 131 n=1 Tax=Blepharisma stoltei TaxID=1481888 RepID=A0AAU9JAZ6_9CILI|nr:unnamed protein product [Blepharisma stoltei]
MMVLFSIFIFLIYRINSEAIFDVSGISPYKISIKIPADASEVRGRQIAMSAIDQQLTRNDNQILSFYSETSFLDFSPKILDFGSTQLYSMKVLSVEVINNSKTEQVELLHQFVMEPTHFQISSFPKKPLLPGCSMTIQIIYLPITLGTHNTLMIFNTNFRPVIYPVQGNSLQNEYFANEIAIESSEEYAENDFYIYNPHNYPIRVESVMSEDSSIVLEQKYDLYGSLGLIFPKEWILLATIISLYKQEGIYESFLLISLSNKQLKVPINVHFFKRGLNFPPRILSFGILTEKDLPYRIPLIGSNSGDSVVEILDILTPPKVDFLSAKVNNKIIAPNTYGVNIGSFTFTPREEGVSMGKIKVKTNSTSTDYILEYMAIVYYDLISYNPLDMIFQSGVNLERVISLENTLNKPILLQRVVPPDEVIITEFKEIWLKPQQLMNVIKISADFKKPQTSYMRLVTNIGTIPIKIIVDDGKLNFLYIENLYENILEGPLEFGPALIGQTRSQKFGLKNPNHFDIAVKSIQNLHYCNLKLSHILTFSGQILNHNIIFPEYSQSTYLFTLKSGSTAYFELTVSILPTVHGPLEFTTSTGKINLPISYTPVSGSAALLPIHFSEIFPGILAQKKITISNLFPIDLKIFSVETDLSFMEAEINKRSIPSGKELSIGKLKFTPPFNKDESIVHDFTKWPTYGYARIWNEKRKAWKDGEMLGTIKVKCDIIGEIVAAIHVTFGKPSLPISGVTKKYTAELNTKLPIYIKAQNPTDFPLQVQLLIAPDSKMGELKKYECAKHQKSIEMLDDEFENIDLQKLESKHYKECALNYQEEIPSIKEANEVRPLPIPKRVKDWSLFGKLKYLLGFHSKSSEYLKPKSLSSVPWYPCGEDSCWCGVNKEEEYRQKYSFFTASKAVTMISPHSSKILGPVYFQPSTLGSYNTSLLLRNNYTLFEEVEIYAEAIGPKLAFTKKNSEKKFLNGKNGVKKELSLLAIDISLDEIYNTKTNYNPQEELYFIRTFELRNYGNYPVEISEILLAGQACKSSGIEIRNCEGNFILDANEFIDIEIGYTPSFNEISTLLPLWIVTANDIFTIPIEAKIPEGLEYNFILSLKVRHLAKECLFFLLALFGGLCFLILRVTVDYKKARLCWNLRSSKDSLPAALRRFEIFQRYNSPQFVSTKVELVETKEENSPPPQPPVLSAEEEVAEKVEQPIKRKKIRAKKFPSTIIQNFDDLSSQAKISKAQVSLPQIIATSHLLNKKTKRHKSVEPEEHEEPAPTPKDSKTNQSADEEDFFIDSYKMNNELFSGSGGWGDLIDFQSDCEHDTEPESVNP